MTYCLANSSCDVMQEFGAWLVRHDVFQMEGMVIITARRLYSTSAGWLAILIMLAALQARKTRATSLEKVLEVSAKAVAFLLPSPTFCSASDSC